MHNLSCKMHTCTRLCCCFSYLSYFILVSSIILSRICEGSTFPSESLSTLHLVQVIARHGDRAPIHPYPTDPYKNSSIYSINGWGELTEIGAKQVYELGSYLRQRYDSFLPRKYRKRDFLMLSSDIDRAIMSAEANLAGLYELGPMPRSRDIFKEWQPVPIHTIPEAEDNFINGKANCPRYSSLFKQFLQSTEFNEFLSENKGFINFVVENSGLAAITEDFYEIFQVQDALRCQRLHNLTLPAWANQTVIEKLEGFKALSFTWRVKTEEMKRLKVGPLFERLLGEMKAKVDSAPSNSITSDREEDTQPYEDLVTFRKMYVYSGHDSTITGILNSLNLFNPPWIPNYASALIIELHRDSRSGEFFVELLYKNDTLQDPHRLDPSLFCGGAYCSFENFSNIAVNFIPSDWNLECQPQSMSPTFTALSKSLENKLMKNSPVDALDSNTNEYNLNSPGHKFGIMLSGLPLFALAILVACSILASLAMLSLPWHKSSSQFSIRSDVYQRLN